jgi:hypothetical protein
MFVNSCSIKQPQRKLNIYKIELINLNVEIVECKCQFGKIISVRQIFAPR